MSKPQKRGERREKFTIHNSPLALWPVLGLLLLWLLTACSPGTVEVAAVAEATPPPTAVVPTTAPVLATLPPIIITATPQPELPSFAAVNLEEVGDEMEGGETAVDPESAADPSETTAPMPTFTAPALPFTSHDEHFWLQRPIPEGGTVWTDKTYPYGSTRGGTLRPHHGVEFYVPQGTPVLATASGTVVVAGEDNAIVYGEKLGFYGKLIIIELDATWQGQPVYTLYAHLSQIYVVEGQRVAALDPIALSGATGVADGPHLHFEVRLGQNSYAHTRNPALWLYPFPDYGVVAGRVTRANGSLVEEAPISLRRIDASSRFLATTSYAGSSVNPDDEWNENFALDDVPAGYYEISVAVGSKRFTEELWVFPYRTTFVEIVIED
jgi:murein DD-endopeptidase MepM/ murein hydrolase activator NlpD